MGSPLTASPENAKELLDPAINGTTGILKAIARSAPSVRHVVVTSSFAAILEEAKLSDPKTVFSEKAWNPVTAEDAAKNPATAYRASKTLAEKAAWDFVKDPANGAKFSLSTINPPMVYGPVVCKTYCARSPELVARALANRKSRSIIWQV